MLQAAPKNIHIYLESNPNPNSLKFVVNEVLVPEGMSFDYPDAASAAEAPLALELFDYSFVDRVFYMSNFVTVTKKADTEWLEVQNTSAKKRDETGLPGTVCPDSAELIAACKSCPAKT